MVNTGIFLGAGILQPLVGWVLDIGKASDAVAAAWDRALLVLTGAALLTLIATRLPGRTRTRG